MTNEATATKVGMTILMQLGRNKFIAMTGCKDFITFTPNEWNDNRFGLQMSIPKNSSKANRLMIYLNANDTYTMSFEKHVLSKKTLDLKIDKVKVFEDVYCDQLQDLFTQVTGMYTSL